MTQLQLYTVSQSLHAINKIEYKNKEYKVFFVCTLELNKILN